MVLMAKTQAGVGKAAPRQEEHMQGSLYLILPKSIKNHPISFSEQVEKVSREYKGNNPQYPYAFIGVRDLWYYKLPVGSGVATRIGREKAGDSGIPNQIIMPFPQISQEHCMVLYAGEGIHMITDLGSSYGTFVNGLKLVGQSKVPLEDGSKIKLAALEDIINIGRFTTPPLKKSADSVYVINTDPGTGRKF